MADDDVLAPDDDVLEGLEQLIPDELPVELADIDSLEAHPKNPRRHHDAALDESLDELGWWGTVIVQRSTRRVLAGHGRVKMLRRAGETRVPVYWLDCDDATALRILAADNRTGDLAGYDDDALARVVVELRDAELLGGTGYSDADVDAIIAAAVAEPVAPSGDSDTDRPDPRFQIPQSPITQPGDVWRLGDRLVLVCGDCRTPTPWAALDGRRAGLVVTSPPYADRRSYDPASGFVPIHPDTYVDWWEAVQHQAAEHLAPDGTFAVNIRASVDANGLDRELYVLDLVVAMVRRWGWHLADEYCWERVGMPGNVGMRLKNQWEPVFTFARDRWKFRPAHVAHASDHAIKPLGPGTGNSSWAAAQGSPGGVEGLTSFGAHRQHEGLAYPGNRLPTFSGSHEAVGHHAAYPVGLPAFLTRLYTDDDDVVADPFAGSGSSLLAAHETGRYGYGIELSPAYCDLALGRIQRRTGLVPDRGHGPVDVASTLELAPIDDEPATDC